MLKRVVVGLIAIVLVGLFGFAAFAWRPAIAPIDPPAAARFAPDLVARGEVLAGAGYCATCHTAKGGAAYAGGYAVKSNFGVIYSTNITPDPATGIGRWSEAAFRRAMHEGVARDGAHLFPAFPYDHFTKVTDADIGALYAFMMTRPAVVAPPRRNGLPFPLSIRALQAGWKLLFFHPGRFAPETAKSSDWNRGAYLAQGLSHCGACHTPRNSLGAEKTGQAFAGAVIDNWIALPLTAANPSPAVWDRGELIAYLRGGVSRYHGVAAGPMSPVVHDGLAKLSDADIAALAAYFAEVDEADSRASATPKALARAAGANGTGLGLQYDPAARLYAAACASCHYNAPGGGAAGPGPDPLRPDLALNSALNLSEPTNLIRVILYGVGAREGAPGVVMPGFIGFGDADVARLAAYLRATRTDKPAWPDLTTAVARVRAQGKGQE